MNAKTDRQLPKLADWFHQRGVQRLFITLGERGVFYSTKKTQGIENRRLDNTQMSNAGGAGDALLAGLAYAWLKQWSLKRSLRFGLAAAAVTLSHKSTSNPLLSLAAVNRRIEHHHAE